MAAIRRAGPSLCPRSGGVHLRFVSLKPLGTSRARGVRSAAGTGTSALQRMGWGAKWPGTLARRPTRAAWDEERTERTFTPINVQQPGAVAL